MSDFGYDMASQPLQKDGKVLVQFFHCGRRTDFFVYVTPKEWQWLNSFRDLAKVYYLSHEYDPQYPKANRDLDATPKQRKDAKRLYEIMHRPHEPLPFYVAWISL